jgi:hypothetical protein
MVLQVFSEMWNGMFETLFEWSDKLLKGLSVSFFYRFQMLFRGFLHMMLRLRMIENDGYERIILGLSCERLTLLSWCKYSVYGQGKRSFCYMRRSGKGERRIH